MPRESSSNNEPGHPPAQAVHHETRNAENSAAHVLPRLLSMRDDNPQLTLLDVGAGSGSITVALAKHIPLGRVTGVDINSNILSRARAIAETAGINNITFQVADAYKLPYDDATFDTTICHQMLTHIPRPWDALTEMLRVTKPGGFVAAREGDFETECIWPEMSSLSKFHRLVADTMSSVGGTPTAGRQLLSWALKAGVKRSQATLTYSSWVYEAPSERQVWVQGITSALRKGSLRDKALQRGLVTEEGIEEMVKAWEKWESTEDASMAMLHGEIILRK